MGTFFINYSPLEQFEIYNLTPILNDKSALFWLYLVQITDKNTILLITNLMVTLYTVLFLLFIIHFVIFFKNKILPYNWKFLYYVLLSYTYQLIRDLITNAKGKINYYSLLVFVFFIIGFLNLFGLVPYSFALTSQFVLTFFFSSLYFFTMNLTGLYYHGINLLTLFFPAGTPILIIPLLIMIEIISYFARMFSLAIRLFANITAGHILLKILSWFVYLLIDIFFLSIWGFLLITLLWGLEFFISLLQAYVFLILLCIYVNDVLNLH